MGDPDVEAAHAQEDQQQGAQRRTIEDLSAALEQAQQERDGNLALMRAFRRRAWRAEDERDRVCNAIMAAVIGIETVLTGDHVDLKLTAPQLLGRISAALKEIDPKERDEDGRDRLRTVIERAIATIERAQFTGRACEVCTDTYRVLFDESIAPTPEAT